MEKLHDPAKKDAIKTARRAFRKTLFKTVNTIYKTHKNAVSGAKAHATAFEGMYKTAATAAD